VLKDCCYGYTQSQEEARTVEVFEDLPQGVRAKNLVEVEVIWKSSGGIDL
jgi:hypothetical protein